MYLNMISSLKGIAVLICKLVYFPIRYFVSPHKNENSATHVCTTLTIKALDVHPADTPVLKIKQNYNRLSI